MLNAQACASGGLWAGGPSSPSAAWSNGKEAYCQRAGLGYTLAWSTGVQPP